MPEFTVYVTFRFPSSGLLVEQLTVEAADADAARARAQESIRERVAAGMAGGVPDAEASAFLGWWARVKIDYEVVPS